MAVRGEMYAYKITRNRCQHTLSMHQQTAAGVSFVPRQIRCVLVAALGALLLAWPPQAQAQSSPVPLPSPGVPPPQPQLSVTEAEPEEPESDEAIVPLNVPPESDVRLLRRFGLAERMDRLPPFLRDTSLKLRLRTFYFNRSNSNGTQSEAWALGGWLAYRSGWLWNSFAIGAVGYTSQPLYAPKDTPGTGLLRPPQESILALGEAYGQLRWGEYALLTGGRQAVNEGYVVDTDLRMIPQTFEGVTLTGKLGFLGYNVGYLNAIKTQPQQDFQNMAKAAGVTTGQNRGLILTRLSAEPLAGLRLYVANYLVTDLFNTLLGKAEYTHRLTPDLRFQIGLQYTDQRSTGAELLAGFSTWNVQTRGVILWRGLVAGAAFSANGDGSNIRSPYGTPSYVAFQDRSFNRANEKMGGLAARYDFGAGTLLPSVRIPGLSVLMRYGQGSDAVDSPTRLRLPATREADLDVTWNVPWVKGLVFRFRNAYVTEGGPVLKSFRLTVNHEIPLL